MTYDDDDSDGPSADPKIAADYKSALGEFLVSFNRLENLIGDVLAGALGILKRPDLYRRTDMFEAKVYALELVCLALPKMQAPDFKRIRDLGGERNTLAHGHFDQNPYSGEYSVVSRGKPVPMPVSKIHAFAERAQAASDDLSFCMAYIWFDGVQVVLPPGAIPI